MTSKQSTEVANSFCWSWNAEDLVLVSQSSQVFNPELSSPIATAEQPFSTTGDTTTTTATSLQSAPPLVLQPTSSETEQQCCSCNWSKCVSKISKHSSQMHEHVLQHCNNTPKSATVKCKWKDCNATRNNNTNELLNHIFVDHLDYYFICPLRGCSFTIVPAGSISHQLAKWQAHVCTHAQLKKFFVKSLLSKDALWLRFVVFCTVHGELSFPTTKALVNKFSSTLTTTQAQQFTTLVNTLHTNRSLQVTTNVMQTHNALKYKEFSASLEKSKTHSTWSFIDELLSLQEAIPSEDVLYEVMLAQDTTGGLYNKDFVSNKRKRKLVSESTSTSEVLEEPAKKQKIAKKVVKKAKKVSEEEYIILYDLFKESDGSVPSQKLQDISISMCWEVHNIQKWFQRHKKKLKLQLAKDKCKEKREAQRKEAAKEVATKTKRQTRPKKRVESATKLSEAKTTTKAKPTQRKGRKAKGSSKASTVKKSAKSDVSTKEKDSESKAVTTSVIASQQPIDAIQSAVTGTININHRPTRAAKLLSSFFKA